MQKVIKTRLKSFKLHFPNFFQSVYVFCSRILHYRCALYVLHNLNIFDNKNK